MNKINFIIIFFLISCITENKPLTNNIVNPKTSISQKPGKIPKDLIFLPNTLEIQKIIKPHAEIRVGPGVIFALKNQILSFNDKVLGIDKKGVWVKIIFIKKMISGWVHNKTLSMPKLNTSRFQIKTNILPRIFAFRNIKTLYDYKTLLPLNVNISKGQSFIFFYKKRKKMLIFIPNTRSLAWVSVKDVK